MTVAEIVAENNSKYREYRKGQKIQNRNKLEIRNQKAEFRIP